MTVVLAVLAVLALAVFIAGTGATTLVLIMLGDHLAVRRAADDRRHRR